MKKQKFHENLQKAAQFAEQTKEQFEEKIPELSSKIEDITGEVKGVENKLGTFSSNVDDRPISTAATRSSNTLRGPEKSLFLHAPESDGSALSLCNRRVLSHAETATTAAAAAERADSSGQSAAASAASNPAARPSAVSSTLATRRN